MQASRLYPTMAEQIAGRIREDIIDGSLAEGQAITEIELSKTFGVSRGPVRDAIKTLASEGFLVATPNVGVTVAARPTAEVMRHIVSLRLQLEQFAVRAVIHSLGASDFDQMRSMLSEMRTACEANDTRWFRDADIEFHRVLVSRQGDRHLLGVWQELVSRMVFDYTRLIRLEDGCDEHEMMLAALEQKNTERALELLAQNIQ